LRANLPNEKREDNPAVTGSECKTMQLWDLSSKILRLKRRPENTGGGFKQNFWLLNYFN
jgi:hypothetical protein